MINQDNIMKATFAAGCFWGVESIFRQVKGVAETMVGYIGGDLDNPTYEDVCGGNTGHAEAIEIEYDPDKISYEELLMVFWSNHNPTTINQQGPDIGEQYRSAIFFHDSEQEQLAKTIKEKLQPAAKKRFSKEIVTEIKPATTFYKAEEYHQNYLCNHPEKVCTSF